MVEVEVEVVAPGGVDEEGGVDGEPGVHPGDREHAEGHVTGALEEQERWRKGEVGEQKRWKQKVGVREGKRPTEDDKMSKEQKNKRKKRLTKGITILKNVTCQWT